MDIGGTARPRAHATWSRLGLGDPLSCFFILSCFLCKNIKARKSLGQFEFRKVPKTSKYTKQVFPGLQSYNKNRGIDGKSP
jgi:hypothetical protein